MSRPLKICIECMSQRQCVCVYFVCVLLSQCKAKPPRDRLQGQGEGERARHLLAWIKAHFISLHSAVRHDDRQVI